MKQNLYHRILLAVTLLTTGLALSYTFFLRESFAVTIRYDFPYVRTSAQAEAQNKITPPESIRPAEAEAPEPWEPDAFYDDFPLWDDYGEDSDKPEILVQFPLNLNEATYGQLRYIPGVGDVTAQRILQYRDYLGGYTKLEQLMEIKGIAQGTFDRIAPYLDLD